MSKRIVAAVEDLLFKSKIMETSRQVEVEVEFPRNSAKLLETVRNSAPSLIILDLESAHFKPIELLKDLKSDPGLKAVPTLGFLSHVETGLIAAGRDAGCDRVMARGNFSRTLPEILRENHG